MNQNIRNTDSIQAHELIIKLIYYSIIMMKIRIYHLSFHFI